ncbi:MAG: hypothetical protein ACYC9S_08535 [Leptospirales bacterium]
MKSVQIVLIGLGRVGTRFYEKFRALGESRVKMLAVCEIDPHHAFLSRISQDRISVFQNYKDAINHWGSAIDIILDTTNVPSVKNDLRHILQESGNHHTVLLPLVASYLLWHMAAPGEELVQDHENPGY